MVFLKVPFTSHYDRNTSTPSYLGWSSLISKIRYAYLPILSITNSLYNKLYSQGGNMQSFVHEL